MALSFRRESAPPAPEALVFADDFPEIENLAADLDREFGDDQWLAIDAAEVDQALEEMRQRSAFALIAVSDDDGRAISATAQLIRKTREAGLLVLLVVGDISSRAMHQLLKEGVADFAPYPEPAGALSEAIDRLRFVRSSGGSTALATVGGQPARKGRLITCYGAAGGVGTSMLAVNLAWELAALVRRDGRRVAILDFNFQYGSVATYLDVVRREAVYELVTDAQKFDQTGLTQALSSYQDRLYVLTAPRDALPLDIISPPDVGAILHLARESFDYVVVDLPGSLMNWSEPVYAGSEQFIAVMETDMRSAQNMFRFLRTLKSEGMVLDKLRFVLNRAPGMTDLSGKARVKRVAESLGINYTLQLPDGGNTVVNACDEGVPLAEVAKSNSVRKEILKLAERIVAEEEAPASQAG